MTRVFDYLVELFGRLVVVAVLFFVIAIPLMWGAWSSGNKAYIAVMYPILFFGVVWAIVSVPGTGTEERLPATEDAKPEDLEALEIEVQKMIAQGNYTTAKYLRRRADALKAKTKTFPVGTKPES